MQVFKCALEVILRNKVFPLVYIVGLSFMGLFMSWSFDFESTGGTFELAQATYAVIDRDQSELSAGIIEALETSGERVELADDKRTLQDAVAKGEVNYLLVIPEGYQVAFEQAVAEGHALPVMDATYSFSSLGGHFVDEQVQNYVSIMQTLMLAYPDATVASLTAQDLSIVAEQADASYIEQIRSVSEIDQFTFFLQWSTYTLFAGIVVCVGMLCATFARVDVRRRNLVSPLSWVSYSAQLALACLVFALVAWAWTLLLATVAFPGAVAQMSGAGLAWCAASLFAYCLVPLACGYLLGQLGASDMFCNAVGNIVGMVLSFFGGAWVPLEMMAPEISTIAQWLPCYWYNTACAQAAHLGVSPSVEAWLPLAQDLGVLVLFALALFGAALVVGRLRRQTAQAGGNAAAAVVVS